MPTYVIEHMESDESDGSFPPWVSLEYTQMLKVAHPSPVIFSSLSPQSVNSLKTLLTTTATPSSSNEPMVEKSTFTTSSKSVGELMKLDGIDLSRVCLLDPKAEMEISPSDREEFDWFLFGGILGDDPPRDRTAELRIQGFPSRHLGAMQMTTDTALAVTRICVQDQIPLNKIPFIDNPTIKFDKVESVEMPFRYVEKDGEPILPVGMKKLLHDDMDKDIEF